MRWGEQWVGWGLLIVLLAGLGVLPTVDAAGRVALVIGNSGYAERPLKNPPNDARAMAALLQKLGFTVTEKTDLTLAGFRQQVNAFLDQSKSADLRLFYYSGHGASYDGDNYLLPIGHGVTRKHELPDQAYSLKTLLRGLKDQSGINLVLLDSCRDAPFGDAKSIWDDSKGMKPIQPQEGVLIGYAAQNGRTASDNSGGGNSLYTKYLLQELGQSLELREALMRVRQGVYDESRGEQRPTMEDEVLGKVHLAEAPSAPREPPPVTTGPTLVRIAGGQFQMGSPKQETGRDSDEEPHSVTVKDFEIGQHEVTVGEFKRFVAASGYKTDAESGTEGCFVHYREGNKWQGGYRAGYSWKNPNFPQDDRYPVVCVSWNDAMAYTAWLSQQTGQRYRLPTEAEWEYAARAGTSTARFWGKNPDTACRYANVADQMQDQTFQEGRVHNCTDGYVYTAPVGSFEGNRWELMDMLGNVWELTCSVYDKDYSGAERECANRETINTNRDTKLAKRGAAWNNTPNSVRSTRRYRSAPDGRSNIGGFRLARSL